MRSLLLITLLSLFGCSKDIKTPEGLLTKFTEDITTKNMDRDYFYQFTTGKMKESIEKLSEQEFEEYRNFSRVKDTKVDIQKKICSSDTKCALTYVIKYDYKASEEDGSDFKSEVKKVANLVKVEDKWKIEDVSNIKTYHESVEPINALEDK